MRITLAPGTKVSVYADQKGNVIMETDIDHDIGQEHAGLLESIERQEKPKRSVSQKIRLDPDKVPSSGKWKDYAERKEFTDKLHSAQHHAQKISTKGLSRCRDPKCKKTARGAGFLQIGTGQGLWFAIGADIQWKETLIHHIVVHGYRPSPEFVDFIRDRIK